MTKHMDMRVSDIRAASRELIRELGFLQKTVARTKLSPSAVHAIIEIGTAQVISSKELCQILRLEKSTVSRLIKSLALQGEIREEASGEDARVKCLQLTYKGAATLHDINAFAEGQVSSALARLDDPAQLRVLQGLQDYARVLRASAGGKDQSMRSEQTTICSGYTTGTIGAVVAMLATRIDRQFHFGPAFETRIATDLAEFITRIDAEQNQIWRAEASGRIVGSISIDGQDLGNELAHLRWFVVDANFRGSGVGRDLLEQALYFCDRNRFREIHLWTLQGLDAARVLYERQGFVLAESYRGDQWGADVQELKFIRPLPDRAVD